MNVNKIRKHFTISEMSLNYIKEIKEHNKLTSESETLEYIIKEHKEKSETTMEMMIRIIANEVAKSMKSDYAKLIKGINQSDRNLQILLEMINGYFIKENVGEILCSDFARSEALDIAEENIKKRISKNRVRRLDNE